METIKDLWASLLASITERSTNPFTAAFAISWVGWNYKFFVLLFSDLSPAKTFAGVNELYPDWTSRLSSGFAFPLMTALLYVFAYPYLTQKLVPWYRERQVKLANSLKDIEGKRVRTVEEVAKLVRDYERKISAADIEAKSARAETAQMREALSAAEKELASLRPALAQAAELNRQKTYAGIEARNLPYISVRREASNFVEKFSARKNFANESVLRAIAPLSIAELQILFYLAYTYDRESTEIEIGDFAEMNATDVKPALRRLSSEDLIDYSNASATIAQRGLAVINQMKDVVNTAE
ncbi:MULTISPECIES: hypothetical protein [unclassified Polaromonas]|uniref:hypothetical protein n=1 Tax=unclassified Polaromonas TaxID=2638319 RepID=UPI000F09918E|nr:MULTISPECIES: hypothetical protein [unclassified Polaromonas]AYQ27747.1 hypothetical protein DT070_06755 [Polaromonas sp. SP1]QGJ17399.1 hypothetical protein F7R28_02670 [Polaromonas sp. Pch-P]